MEQVSQWDYCSESERSNLWQTRIDENCRGGGSYFCLPDHMQRPVSGCGQRREGRGGNNAVQSCNQRRIEWIRLSCQCTKLCQVIIYLHSAIINFESSLCGGNQSFRFMWHKRHWAVEMQEILKLLKVRISGASLAKIHKTTIKFLIASDQFLILSRIAMLHFRLHLLSPSFSCIKCFPPVCTSKNTQTRTHNWWKSMTLAISHSARKPRQQKAADVLSLGTLWTERHTESTWRGPGGSRMPTIQCEPIHEACAARLTKKLRVYCYKSGTCGISIHPK